MNASYYDNCAETHSAYEAVCVPLGRQGGNIVFHDGAVASAAFGGEHVEVVVAAIWPAVLLVEALLAELFAALGAEEVFCVPGLLQCGNAFLRRTEKQNIRNIVN